MKEAALTDQAHATSHQPAHARRHTRRNYTIMRRRSFQAMPVTRAKGERHMSHHTHQVRPNWGGTRRFDSEVER